MTDIALEIRGLTTQFEGRGWLAKAVDGINLTVKKGEIVGLVGESGSGKSVVGFSILGLIDAPGKMIEGSIKLSDDELFGKSDSEMAKLRGLGWLVVKRQGARGRVTEYALAVEKLLKDTRPIWAAVGPDFEQRMEGQGAKPAEATDAKVVPLQRQGRAVAPPEVDSSTEWGLARSLLYTEDPARFSSWLAALTRGERVGRRLYLTAPSRFHAHYVATHLNAQCLNAVRQVDADIDEVIILG